MSAVTSSAASDRQWFIVGRWQEYEGEGRANLLRIVAIGSFYTLQLANFYLFTVQSPDELPFHQKATALSVAWVLLSLAILMCLRRQILPAVLKFVSTGCDVVLLTALAIAGNGANSPLVFAYFLIIALAALRFSLRLVWFATLGCMAGYLATVGAKDSTWFDAHHIVPPVEQLVMLLSLGLTGIIVGQVIRRVRGLAEDYARRMAAQRGAT